MMDFEDAPNSPFRHPGNRGMANLSYFDSAPVCSIGTLKVELPRLDSKPLRFSTVLAVTTAAALVEVHARQGKEALYMWQTAPAVGGARHTRSLSIGSPPL